MSYVGYDSGVRIDARAAVAAGGSFVLRYLSRGSWTQVTAEEIAEYLAVGLRVGLVFETTANRALAGYGAGKSDAQYVREQLHILGFPEDMEVFFAVDSDTDPVSVEPYFQGVRDAYAAGGVYGSYRVVHKIETEFGIAGWQTAAWSNGARDGAALVFQSGEQKRIGDVTVDVDYADSFGRWAYGGPDMTPEDLLDLPIPREGQKYDGSAQAGNTDLRAVIANMDAGWEESARILIPILAANQAALVAMLQSMARQLVDLTAGVAKLAAEPPATTVTLSTQDRTDMVLLTLRTLGAALGNVKVVTPEPAPAGADTPA